MFPVFVPLAGGLNVTVAVALWPGAKLRGRLSPEMLKPAPVTFAELTVSVEFPALLRVADCDWVLPIATLPKLMLAGLTVRLGVTALPDKVKEPSVPPALAMDTVPLDLPCARGVY